MAKPTIPITKPPVHKMPSPQRRQQIIQVAMNLFSRKGFDGTTTREISKAAGVSEAIIFRHFATKEDLYAAIIDFIIRDCGETFYSEIGQVMQSKDDMAVFETVALKILEAHWKDPSLLRLLLFSGLEGHKLSHLFMETYGRPFNEWLGNYISQRMADKAFKKNHPMILVRGFLGMVSHYSLTRILYKDSVLRKSNQEMAREFAQIFLQGVLQEPLRKKRSS
ncbi:MAG: TetR/AcrR family transcriptional regulator [Terriglobia bacterium]